MKRLKSALAFCLATLLLVSALAIIGCDDDGHRKVRSHGDNHPQKGHRDGGDHGGAGHMTGGGSAI